MDTIGEGLRTLQTFRTMWMICIRVMICRVRKSSTIGQRFTRYQSVNWYSLSHVLIEDNIFPKALASHIPFSCRFLFWLIGYTELVERDRKCYSRFFFLPQKSCILWKVYIASGYCLLQVNISSKQNLYPTQQQWSIIISKRICLICHHQTCKWLNIIIPYHDIIFPLHSYTRIWYFQFSMSENFQLRIYYLSYWNGVL